MGFDHSMGGRGMSAAGHREEEAFYMGASKALWARESNIFLRQDCEDPFHFISPSIA